jgi:hypothetical protein
MLSRIRGWISCVAALLAWVTSSNAMAEGGTTLGEITEAARRSGDMSREALVSILGQVVNNPLAAGGSGGGDTILASVFQITNGALFVVGGIFATYLFFKKMVQSGHDGTVFDKQRSVLWDPIRLIWGAPGVRLVVA